MKFVPEELNRNCRLYKYRDLLPPDKSIYWCYDSIGPPIETDYNSGCFDVRKSKVHKVHLEALGYTMAVDPSTCRTPFLSKSLHQCKHEDIHVHTENCSPRPDRIYELYMDNLREIRYFYCNRGQDFIVMKYRRSSYFTSFDYGTARPAADRLRRTVDEFCAEFGIDFAELDILLHEGKPYIIDVNNIAGNGLLMLKIDNPAWAERQYIKQIKTL